jgi:hypothetical protein
MCDFTTSLLSLAKNNAGKFKSEKQAAMFNRMANNGVLLFAGGNVYGNTWSYEFIIDDAGIIAVNKISYTKAGAASTEAMYSRDGKAQEQRQAAKDDKEIKRIKREINSLKKRIKQRQSEFDAGLYPSVEMFNNSQQADLNDLAEYQDKLVA